MNTKIKVASVQFAPNGFDITGNVQRMCKHIQEIKNRESDIKLIVFPELITTGYECKDEFYEMAEDPLADENYSINAIRQCAKENHVHVVYGFPEKIGDKVYNSQILIGPDGEIIGTYQKVHLFQTEQKYFTPGDTYKVFSTAIGKLGLFICYDANFPEVARILTLMGADVLINSTNWENPYADDMDLAMRARCLDNATYLICSNRIGAEKNISFFGHSQIIDPVGKVLTIQREPIEDVVYAELDFSYQTFLREGYYKMLKERRPDTYHKISEANN